jgi:hypothetical protein
MTAFVELSITVDGFVAGPVVRVALERLAVSEGTALHVTYRVVR